MEAAFEASGVRDTMWVLGNRFSSFTKLWPHNRRRKCNPKNLSKTGFYHVGTEDSPDAAMCFMCEKQLDEWEPSDDVVAEHRKHAPACPLLNLDMEENRIKTFQYWPADQFQASIAEFAAAGFFHAPSLDALDQLECFHCHKTLTGWEAEDDPFEEHLSHSKRCTFVKKAIANRASQAEEEQEAETAEDEEPAAEEDNDDNNDNDENDEAMPDAENAAVDEQRTVEKKQTKRSAIAKTKAKASGGNPPAKQAKPLGLMQLEDDDVQDMSLKEFLTAKRDEKIHSIVSATEAKIKQFQEAAANTREQLSQLLHEAV
eukprot:m.11310 g.11310  ORF g.11310 m.11310 type:complete len:315 (+) comp9786_c0_seq1:107-1051(+)